MSQSQRKRKAQQTNTNGKTIVEIPVKVTQVVKVKRTESRGN